MFCKTLSVTTMMMALLVTPSHSKNLGQHGHVFPIIEVNMLDFIYDRLTFLDRTGVLADLKEKAIADVKESLVRPKAPRIGTTTHPRVFYHEPRFTLQADITDVNGKKLYAKGSTYNAMDAKTYPNNLGHHFSPPPWTGCLVFFDGDDIQQLNWVKQHLSTLDAKSQAYQLMLTGGNIKTTSAYLKRPVRFNQHGWMSKKLGITHVPSVVIQEDVRFKITEIDVSKLSLKLSEAGA